MIRNVIDFAKIVKLKQIITDRRLHSVVITCHMSPDGDAIGSSLALYHLLRAFGKKVAVITPDYMTSTLRFLPGARDITAYSVFQSAADYMLRQASVVFCLDFNAAYRVDKLSEALLKAPGYKVMIDHHIDPEPFCDLIISHPEATSTCELLFRALLQCDLLRMVNKDCAECIYTGMMTDTGNFSYNSNVSDLYRMIALLVDKGIDKDRIYSLAINTASENRVRLMGYSSYQKMQVFPEDHAALITLNKRELEEFDYHRGDTESLVNVPLQIPYVKWSLFLREESEYIKVSARSKGDFAVNEICTKYFNGGGHKNASGGEFRGTLDEAVEVFLHILSDLRESDQKENKISTNN